MGANSQLYFPLGTFGGRNKQRLKTQLVVLDTDTLAVRLRCRMHLTAAPLDSLTDVFRCALLRRAPACVCFSFASVNPPPAPRIFCYGFGSCLRLGLTYITLINKGCTALRMSHYGISPGRPAPPASIESHQSPHLSSGWLGVRARCLASLFCGLFAVGR